MQNYQSPSSVEQSSPIVFSQRNYNRFLFFLGMSVLSVVLIMVLRSIDQKYNTKNSYQDASKLKSSQQHPQENIESQTGSLMGESPPLNIQIETGRQQDTNNDLGLTLEEYSNLSDPSEAVLNCLRNEGGKGCFTQRYSSKSYSEEAYNSMQASDTPKRITTGEPLPYWYPSSLPPINYCPSSTFIVEWQERNYCGRRLIK